MTSTTSLKVGDRVVVTSIETRCCDRDPVVAVGMTGTVQNLSWTMFRTSARVSFDQVGDLGWFNVEGFAKVRA